MSTTKTQPGRLVLTAHAAGYLLLAIPALALFCLEVTFIPLTIVTVGVVALQAIVPATAALAGVHRRMASRILAEPVEPFYKETGAGWLGRLQTWATDPARWRDLAWLLVASTLGFALSLLTVTLFLSAVFYLIHPFLWAVTPEGVFDQPLGFMTIDTLGEQFLMWIVAAVMFLLWWGLVGPLTRLRARIDQGLLSRGRAEMLERRVQEVSESRAETVDFSAAELRRIERDLHDGAQARLVALGMSLGLADELIANDPEAAKRLLLEARSTTTAALGDLRSVVRGIHPPVLADRGLGGAVQALALDMPIPITTTIQLPQRPPAPVESATYFAVAECLANIGKHAEAARGWVSIDQRDDIIHLEVGDDGVGGASVQEGTGLAGVARRLAAFDGKMALSSPAGGPTIVSMEVPCVLSSERTTRSSGTA